MYRIRTRNLLAAMAIAGPAVTLASAHALAADLLLPPLPAPIPQLAPVTVLAPTSNWTGVTLGVSAGYAFSGGRSLTPDNLLRDAWEDPAGVGADVNDDPSPVDLEPAFDMGLNDKPDDFTVHGVLGYLHQVNHSFVVGMEGDIGIGYDAFSRSATLNSSTDYNADLGDAEEDIDGATTTENFSSSTERLFDGSVRVKAGFLVSPSLLVFGTGGIAFGVQENTITYTATTTFDSDGGTGVPGSGTARTHTSSSNTTWKDTLKGWTAGAGAQWMLRRGLSLTAEYRYTKFDDTDGNVMITRASDASDLPNTSPISADVTSAMEGESAFRVGLTAHLNGW